jgi:hypothetical protein
MAEDPSAVETLVGDLERRLRADYRVVGETSARAACQRHANFDPLAASEN